MDRLMSSSKGFTLIELMITVTIVAILAAIAIPSYLNYTRRAYFSEVVTSTGPAKLGVTECYQTTGTLGGCTGGTNHIPADITGGTGAVASVTTAGGTITVVPNDANGLTSSDTYILAPSPISGTLKWTASGGGVSNGYAS